MYVIPFANAVGPLSEVGECEAGGRGREGSRICNVGSEDFVNLQTNIE